MKWPTINYADGSSFLRIDIAGIAVCLVLSGAAYFLGARPLMASRDDRAAREQALADAREQAKALVANTRGLRTQLSGAQIALAKIEIALRPPASINQRIAELTALAGQCKCEMQSIQPGALATAPRFAQIPIQIAGTGTYRSCADFLHRLRDHFPDTAVRGFELSVTPGDPTTTVSFNFQLIWYVQPVTAESRR
ncbi:hypothetical protein BH09PLA1_BH09PLA1_08050 [soil metagenome]